MRWIIILAVLGLAIGAAYMWFTSLPSARQLDTVDSIFSDEAEYKLVADNVSYGEKPRQDLDVWTAGNGGDDGNVDAKPVLVFFYGGSWNSGEKDDYAFAAKAYAARGFVVVLPNYRLFPETVYPAMAEDSAAAIAWTYDNIAQHGGDPDKIFVAGHSAGAYNAMITALDRQWLGRLGKDTNIIKGVVGLAGPYDFYPFTSDSSKNSFGKEKRPEVTQPITYARGDAPPLWLASGDNDDIVELRNSIALAGKIKELGGIAEVKEYASLDHYEIIMALSRPFRGKALVLDDSVEFMKAQLDQ